MNRRDRRRAKALKVSIFGVEWGRCTLREPVPCFLCGEEAREWPWPDGQSANAAGVVRVVEQDGRVGEPVALCEACWSSAKCGDILRRVVGPGTFTEGGYATREEAAEIAAALVEKHSTGEHDARHDLRQPPNHSRPVAGPLHPAVDH